MYAVPAMAQEEHHEAAKKMLPALDVSLFAGVLFWLIIAFIFLLGIMSLIGVPGIRKTLSKRQRALDSDLKAARKASEEAEAVVTAYEESLREARAYAQETVNGIVAEAAELAQKRRDTQDAEIKHRLVVAQKNIADAKEQAMQDATPFVNDIVQLIFQKVMEPGIVYENSTAGA
jgi:F0F1-type ATP synthase membrane subunit b/b'